MTTPEPASTASAADPLGSADEIALLEQALLAAEQIAFHYDAADDRLTLRGAVKALTGRSAEQIGHRLDDLLAVVHRDDLAMLHGGNDQGVTAGEATLTRFRFVHPDGHATVCQLRGQPFAPRANAGAGASAGASAGATAGASAGADSARHGVIGRVQGDTQGQTLDPTMRLFELIEFLPEFVAVHTTDGRCVAINAAGRRLVGIDRGEDITRTLLTDLVTDSTSVPVHLLLSVVLAQGSHGTDVVMVNRRSGRQIPAFWSATLMDDRTGGQRFLVAIARDMTEQLEIEWELRQNQRRLSHALEVSRLGEWSLDIRTQSSTQSRRVAEIFGHVGSADQWNYRAFLNHIHPDDRERVDRLFSRSLETGRDLDFEARIIRKDGELRWISARGSMNRGLGGNERVIGSVIQDITARKQTEQRDRFLADVSVPLNTLLDHHSTLEQVARLAVPFLGDHCSIDLADEKGQLTRIVSTSSLLAREAVGEFSAGSAQPTAMRLMLEAGEVVMLDIVEPGSLDGFARTRSERLSLRALDIKSYLGVPLTLRGRHIGVLHFYRTAGESHYSAGDRNVAVELATRVAVALENARLYKALQDSDHRKDEFLAMLSHELRNPLESLSVGVSLIEQDDADKRDWAQGMMRGQIAKLASILEDLLDVSRYTFNKVVLNREHTALAPLVSVTVEEMRAKAEERGYALVFEASGPPMYADVDYVRISQVIGNLLTNAIKYGEDRGTLRVTMAYEDEQATISVTDDGVGIAPEELPNVFELFSQVDTTIDRTLGGLGMGLTLVRRIAEMHEGTISARSPGAGKGSTFVLRLPASLEDTSTEELVAPSDAPRLAQVPMSERRRLLLVDDNLETISALQKLFMMKGYEVETANDGLAAIALAESYRPQMAVLDIGLPGANGYEVAEALRRQYDGEPLLLIALSGYGQQKDRDRSRQAGFDHHLLKPANFKAIIDLLQAE